VASNPPEREKKRRSALERKKKYAKPGRCGTLSTGEEKGEKRKFSPRKKVNEKKRRGDRSRIQMRSHKKRDRQVTSNVPRKKKKKELAEGGTRERNGGGLIVESNGNKGEKGTNTH